MARVKLSVPIQLFHFRLMSMKRLDRMVFHSRFVQRRLARHHCKMLYKLLKSLVFDLCLETGVKVVNFCYRHGLARGTNILFRKLVLELGHQSTDADDFFHDDRIFSPTSLF